MASFKPVIALSRGLAVLRAVNTLAQATVGSIHAATGLDKATIVRMLETLQHENLVMRGTARNVYLPTGHTRQLASGFDPRDRLGALAAPFLGELGARHGWPAFVSIADDGAMLLVQTFPSAGPLVMRRQPGYRAPMLVSASGRVHLSFCAAEERARLLGVLAARKDAWAAAARRPEVLQALFEEVRSTGFATTDDAYSESENEGALWSMAVPILGTAGLYGALNLAFVRRVVSVPVARTRFLRPLQNAAERLAQQLEQAGLPAA